MNSAYSINPRRFLLLIRSYLKTNLNLILILTAVFSGLIILNAVWDTFFINTPGLYRNMYFLLLYVSAFFITMRIGKDLHDIRKGSTWLLLPASAIEKFLTLLLLPTLILICGAAIYMAIMSFVVEQGIGLFISTYHEIFNPFDTDFFKGLNIFLVMQAPFLLGAIYFRKHGMSFTFLSIFIYTVILSVFLYFSIKYFLGDYLESANSFYNSMGTANRMYSMTMAEKYMQFNSTWKPLISNFFLYVFPPVCWVTAFFSLKEMEQ